MYRSAIELTISGLPQNFSGAINEKRLVVLCTIVLLHRTPQGAKFRRGGPLKTGTFSGDGSLVEKKKAKRQA